MAHTYTMAYRLPAVNVSTAILGAAFAALPRDLNTEAELGLSTVSDNVTILGSIVTRTIVLNSAPGPLGDPYTRDALENFYTESFSQGLVSRVQAAPVVYT
jgi:hypothetical protein